MHLLLRFNLPCTDGVPLVVNFTFSRIINNNAIISMSVSFMSVIVMSIATLAIKNATESRILLCTNEAKAYFVHAAN